MTWLVLLLGAGLVGWLHVRSQRPEPSRREALRAVIDQAPRTTPRVIYGRPDGREIIRQWWRKRA